MILLETKSKYETIPGNDIVDKTARALNSNGMKAIIAEDGADARKLVQELIPEGASVMDMTSTTLDSIGIAQDIHESGRYNPIKKKLAKMDRKTQNLEMQQLGAAPEWAIGSVHAITQDGSVLIASQSGSQIPAYAYGAVHVVWVAGAQKIVKNFDEALKRIYEHALPLEIERAKKAYGTGSAVNKLLVVNNDIKPGRMTIIIVKDNIGF